MSDTKTKKITGYVMPVGNGAVGKTSMALTLQHDQLPADWQNYLKAVKKTINMEFQYATDKLEAPKTQYHILHQYLIPPGQKDFEVDPRSRSYDDVLEIYAPIIRRIDVVLLSYKVTQLDSFNDLEYWVEKTSGICNDKTNFILVGTHLDQKDHREVSKESIVTGTKYVYQLLKGIRTTWQGHCTSLEVSNTSGENIRNLKTLISQGLILSSGHALH